MPSRGIPNNSNRTIGTHSVIVYGNRASGGQVSAVPWRGRTRSPGMPRLRHDRGRDRVRLRAHGILEAELIRHRQCEPPRPHGACRSRHWHGGVPFVQRWWCPRRLRVEIERRYRDCPGWEYKQGVDEPWVVSAGQGGPTGRDQDASDAPTVNSSPSTPPSQQPAAAGRAVSGLSVSHVGTKKCSCG